jgi:hypothetical protein
MDRKEIIQKARSKYIPSVTMNITEALRLYLKNDTEEQIPLFITQDQSVRGFKEAIKKIRPRCEECDGELKMRRDVMDIYGNKYLTAWFCDCGRIEYSDKTIEEWTEILIESRE